MSDEVLVTGAFGLVGSATVKRLGADGRRVIATGRDRPANRKAAQRLPAGVDIRWADLTNFTDVERVVSEVAPAVIVHLAALIPPTTYRDAAFARRVNVDATAALVRCAEALPNPPRFVHASSSSVYGAPNPHRFSGLCGPDTPLRPCELYGQHKLEAEETVRSSRLDWVILRLGGVLTVDPSEENYDPDILFFGTILPTDGRVHTVDVRDVARAFAAATSADVAGETLLVAGDESHLLTQRDTTEGPGDARGLTGLVDAMCARPGNPDSDDGWFLNCWMDVTRAQEALAFQHHSWPEMLAEMREIAGWKRHATRLAAPFVRAFIKRHCAYRNVPGEYATPWEALRMRYGEPGLTAADR
ncbi:oxidoreductase [Mycobacterium alsense]|uniref:Oxidoreductase n=1 Tax=Mycobacterium alsense TaxID=324058 RepID=A0ABD6P342_9MYCO|nr:NAD-dependent epimerase/dehydratase family protein [Mycobacterium alsense]OBG38005.1 oxidoreductase [Mycobacterium alsense]